MTESNNEIKVTAKDEPRIGVYVCHCGINIAGVIDVYALKNYALTLPNVVVAQEYKFMCSDNGQDLIKKDIEAGLINREVVAACSPRMHEPTFRQCVSEVGINPYLMEMANIREQCSWVHSDKKRATEKTKTILSAAILKNLPACLYFPK